MTSNPESQPEDLTAMAAHARLLREHYLQDPHRPGYHFVVPEGVHAPVDPNAALFWNGRYHLCYIYQHEGLHYWGHISSVDLVHWRHHPPALSPGEGDEGIFSGGVFIDQQGVATITYWRLGQPDGIAIATSTDPDLDHWHKNPHNPVLASTGFGWAQTPDGRVYGTADPSAIWFHHGRYYLLTGNLLVLKEFGEKRGQPEHLGDTLYLFVSDDLTHWEYLHPFYQSRREWTREFEDDMCPDFFALPSSPQGGPPSDRHMILFISHTLGCQYYLGRYAADHFEPESHGRMTWVDNQFFAPESLADPRGRRIMWAWIIDPRTPEAKAASGWSGVLSLPRVLWLGEDGTLRLQPAPELQCLRHRPRQHTDLQVLAGTDLPLPDCSGNSLELLVEMIPGEAAECGVKLGCAKVSYHPAEGRLQLHTSLGDATPVVESAPFQLAPGEPLRLQIFVDRCIVEVFANDRQAIARHHFPAHPDSTGVALFALGGNVAVPSVSAWDIL